MVIPSVRHENVAPVSGTRAMVGERKCCAGGCSAKKTSGEEFFVWQFVKISFSAPAHEHFPRCFIHKET
jgi:hypothetical protein